MLVRHNELEHQSGERPELMAEIRREWSYW
jgi:hypothetical protein